MQDCTAAGDLRRQGIPEAYKADLETSKGDKEKLGTISFADKLINNKRLVIVNAYTQYHWKGSGQKADYEAIRNCYKQIKKQFFGMHIAYPAIGAGLAGGDWEIIKQIIGEELEGETHTFVEFSK